MLKYLYLWQEHPLTFEESPFQPVTTSLLPIAALPDDLSHIYVPMKPPPETTDYIIEELALKNRLYQCYMFLK